MRKAIASLALIVGIMGLGTSVAGDRSCDDHGGVTAATGFKIGTTQDADGRDSLDACSDSGGATDGFVRAGIGTDESVSVTADGWSDANDAYVQATLDADGAHLRCGSAGDAADGEDGCAP